MRGFISNKPNNSYLNLCFWYKVTAIPKVTAGLQVFIYLYQQNVFIKPLEALFARHTCRALEVNAMEDLVSRVSGPDNLDVDDRPPGEGYCLPRSAREQAFLQAIFTI